MLAKMKTVIVFKLAALHPDAQQDACDRACDHEEIAHQGKDVSAETDTHIIQ
jgi:hypothetical protein